MDELAIRLIINSGSALWHALCGLLVPAGVFAALGIIVKGRSVINDARKALPETRFNLLIIAFNIVLLAPFLALFSTWMSETFQASALQLISPDIWPRLPAPLVILAAVFVGDFVGYWRHRLEHTKLLWPSHAVHHSDTQMTWLSLERFHPVNRLTTMAIDSAVLLLIGFPAYALVANNLVRHFYGYFIHADLPWTYGKLGSVLVSPVMHRWHHAADENAYNTNFATVFSVFDRWHGTFRVPGPCRTSLGVTEHMGFGFVRQLLYPFRPSAYRRSTGGMPPSASASSSSN